MFALVEIPARKLYEEGQQTYDELRYGSCKASFARCTSDACVNRSLVVSKGAISIRRLKQSLGKSKAYLTPVSLPDVVHSISKYYIGVKRKYQPSSYCPSFPIVQRTQSCTPFCTFVGDRLLNLISFSRYAPRVCLEEACQKTPALPLELRDVDSRRSKSCLPLRRRGDLNATGCPTSVAK